MISKIKRKFADRIYENMSFPKECRSGNELNWICKDNCPMCIAQPIEMLSNAEYHKKYPANHRLQFGITTIYLCDYHLKELKADIGGKLNEQKQSQ